MDYINISSVCECLEVFNEIRKEFFSSLIGNSPVATNLLFRGISDSKYELIPGILRKDMYSFGDSKIENAKYTAWQGEKNILKDFISEASGYIKDFHCNDFYKWSEYAQHYGVPTRYLDWTSNPLVALYFACRDNDKQDASIWLLHPMNYRKFLSENGLKSDLKIGEIINQLIVGEAVLDYPILYKPYYIDSRMSAQSSFFMVWGNRSESFEQLIPEEHYIQIEGARIARGVQQKHLLTKFNICHDRKQQILRELDMMGISDKTLFPGLDGIGRYIERKYRFNYGEAIDFF